MAVMDDSILKPEEVYGNFDPSSEESQESFLLNVVDTYPGELPYALPEKEPVIADAPDEIADENILLEELPTTDDEAGETWDLFEDESGIPSQEDVLKEAADIESQDIARFNELLKEEEDNLPPPLPLESELDEPESSSRVSFDLTKKEPEIQDDFVPQLSGDEVVELDDEFKAMLEDDLDLTKNRKPFKKKEAEAEFNEQKNLEGLAAFRSVEDLGASETIDISSIKAVHPSTFLIQEDEVALMNEALAQNEVQDLKSYEQSIPILETEADLKKELKNELKQEKKEKKQNKDKKERKPFPFIPVLIYAGAILIPLILVAGTYYYFNSMKFPKLHNTIFKTSKIQEILPSKPIKKDTLVVKKEIWKDTVAEMNISEPVRVEEKPEPKKLVIKEPIANEVNKRAERPILNSKKPTKITEKPKYEKVNTTSNQQPKEEMYQIELYSTPSIEDAEIWMNKLKKRSINATLQLQKVRGMTVYKIRYGYFKSRQEAKESAIKLGFSRSWIDRIK